MTTVRDVFTKVYRLHEDLTRSEIDTLLEWVDMIGQPTPETITLPQLTQQVQTLQDQNDNVFRGNPAVDEISQISNNAGLFMAGEFRAGNGVEPGNGFTGGRYGYPGFTYGGTTYFLVGVSNDVIQVGLSLTDGKIYAGAGGVVLDASGITFENESGVLYFKDATGNPTIRLYGNAEDFFLVQNRLAGKGIKFLITLTDGTYPYVKLQEDPVNANVMQMDMTIGSSGSKISMGSEVVIWAGVTGTTGKETVFNEGGFDIDFRIESNNDSRAFVVDASADRIQIGVDHYLPVRGAANPNIYFNEANQDMDFHYEGSTDANLIFGDAGLDAVGIGAAAESGFKLKVGGDLKVTGEVYLSEIASAPAYVDNTAAIYYLDTGILKARGKQGATETELFLGALHSTYTPTGTIVTNIDAAGLTPGVFNYVRIANWVFFNGNVTVDPTAAGATNFTLSLPIASTFTAASDVAGTVARASNATEIGALRGDMTNHVIDVNFTAAITTSHAVAVYGWYQIK